jgi:hypothetical protein
MRISPYHRVAAIELKLPAPQQTALPRIHPCSRPCAQKIRRNFFLVMFIEIHGISKTRDISFSLSADQKNHRHVFLSGTGN